MHLPGRWLLAIAPFVFDDVVLTTVIHQSVADMRDEWLRAGSSLAERVRALGRGYVAFWVLVVIAPVVFSKRQSVAERVRVFSQFAGGFDMVTIRQFRFVVILFVLGLGVGYFFARAQPVLYTSSAGLQVIPPRVAPAIFDPTRLAQQTLSDRIRSTTQVVLSRARLERLIKEFNLYEAERQHIPMEDAVALMRSRIAITPNEIDQSASGGQIAVSYTGSEPVQVRNVTEKISAYIIEESLKDSVRRAEGTVAFIEGEVEHTRKELIDATTREQKSRDVSPDLRLEVDTLETTYKTLLTRRIEARMNVNLERRQIGEQFNLLDPAQLPQRPIGPTRLQVSLLGGAAGIATAVVLAFFAFLYGFTGGRRKLATAETD